MTSFLGSRLRAPAASRHYVSRPRLLRLLDEVTASPITLVAAPAGSGKTSLLVDWCSASSIPTAWLSLDESDRDGDQLWTAVAAALADLVEGLSERRLSVDRAGSPSSAVAALIGLLDGDHPATAVLIVDNVDLVEDDEAIMTSLALFLSSLPEWLHVVLLSRRTPKLPIDRLRARGQLGEVHFIELRFSDEEAEEMLNALASSLTEEEVTEAVARASGWAAGLQLTALAARSRQAQAGSPLGHVGDGDLFFADYVRNEVLAAEPHAIVELLLDTCVVTRFNPALASALTGRPDAGELLLEAESRGLFVTRLGRVGVGRGARGVARRTA